jgi:SPP1 family predicted phage head-tail adaptor
MQIGQLNDRITIEQGTDVADTSGGRSTTWSLYGKRWAFVRFSTATEAFRLGQQAVEQIVKFTIHRDTGVTESMRVVFDSINYSITSVVSPPRGLFTELTAVVEHKP